MEIYLPDANIVERIGEEINLLPVVFKDINFRKDTIKLVLPEGTVLVHQFDLYFGKYNNNIVSYKFVVISDPHIGHGWNGRNRGQDFGTSGYNDDTIPSQTTPDLDRVRNIVDAVNYLALFDHKIKFVLLTGDITESAEKSEVKKAYRIFTKRLKLPCIPIMGNHDLWPYVWEDDRPCPWGREEHGEGNIILGGYFYGSWFEGFKNVYINLREYFPIPLFKEGPYLLEPEPAYIYPYKTYCSNFTFQYYNNLFIGIDFNSRTHAPSMWGFGCRTTFYR